MDQPALVGDMKQPLAVVYMPISSKPSTGCFTISVKIRFGSLPATGCETILYRLGAGKFALPALVAIKTSECGVPVTGSIFANRLPSLPGSDKNAILKMPGRIRTAYKTGGQIRNQFNTGLQPDASVLAP